MKQPQPLRLVLVCSLFGAAILSTPLLAITPSEFDALRSKADRGNSIAQYNLGLAHADRSEAIYDPAQAYAWLSLAAANGTNGKALADLTKLLTPAQLVEGKHRLALLTASPISSAADASSPIVSTVTASPTPVVTPADADADQKKLSAELSAAWKENELLKAGLTAQLADANKRVAIAEAALASKDKEISSLQKRIAETSALAVSTTAAIQTQPVAVSAELSSLRTERDELQIKANNATSGLADLRAQNAKAAAAQSTLQDKLAATTTALAEARRAQSHSEAETASLKASADRASAERLASTAQLETVSAELAALKALPAPSIPAQSDPRIAKLETERDTLAATINTLTEERTSLSSKLTAAESANAALSAAAVTLPTPEADARFDELAAAKAETDTKLEASLRSFTLQQAEIDRLQKSLASIDEERATIATQLETANAELASLRPQAASAATISANAETLRTQFDAANQRLSSQSSELITANRSLADARATIDTATADLVATRDQLRQTQAQSAAFAVENQQLKTRLALTGSLASTASPSRPGTIPSISINLPSPNVAPATPVVAPEPAPRFHTVAPGDSLSKISKQYYGTAARWNEILQANPTVIRNPDSLALGTQLRIP